MQTAKPKSISGQKNEHKLLIGVDAYGVRDILQLKPCVGAIGKDFEILALSSLYSDREQDKEKLGLRFMGQNIRMAISCASDLGPKECLSLLKSFEKNLNETHKKEEYLFYLLAYDKLSSMLPSVCLPHPELHLADLWLSPAAELWPDYLHPILDQSLSDMARASLSNMQSQFIAQSKCLLDF